MDEVYDHLELQGRKTKTGDLVTIDIGALIGGGAVGFAHIWKHITPEMQGKILLVLPRIKSFAVSTANSAGAAVNIYGGKATIALAAVYLSYEAMRNIHRWWKGEISGRRVAKNIIDSCGTVAAGAGGAMAGAAAGSFFGPVGTVVGGVIGSVVGSAGGGVLIDTLTQELFDIPKDEALERAYNCLGVVSRTTDREINRAFRALSLKYHPDKGGSQQSFLMLQTCMGIIKVARGEEY
uniref:J domain-containing protein n=1 Tax=Plectus sambesii TaxID=2011161 RepID=A0A914UMB9_9BILA